MHQATQSTNPLVFAIGRIALFARLGVIIPPGEHVTPSAEQGTEEREDALEKACEKAEETADKAETWVKNDIADIDADRVVQVWVDDKTKEVFGFWQPSIPCYETD